MFSSALLLYINPEISITRGNSVPDDFTGIVFDIGRGEFDHHQKDSRIRENGVPYAAFGLLWDCLLYTSPLQYPYYFAVFVLCFNIHTFAGISCFYKQKRAPRIQHGFKAQP